MSELYDEVTDEVSGGKYYRPRAQRTAEATVNPTPAEIPARAYEPCYRCGIAYDTALYERCPTCPDEYAPFKVEDRAATYGSTEFPEGKCIRCVSDKPTEQNVCEDCFYSQATILDEAKRLVDGARGGDYGHPLDDFDALGRFWGAILTRWQEGVGGGLHFPDIPAETVALMLAAIKINREAARSRRDNIVDLAGYTYTIELIKRRRGQ